MSRTEPARRDFMARTRLLHVGDVHYPEALNERLADLKDRAFPSHIVESSVLKPLELVMRELLSQVELGCDAILLSGDLTDFGNVESYQRCVEYLRPVIDSLGPERIHAVPGNHDVDRAAIAGAGGNILAKFESFKRVWEGLGLPVLVVDGARITEIESPTGSRARVLSVNSSFGCGEKRYLPEGIADELAALIGKYATNADPKDAFRLVGETLDTPAFQQKDIEEACAGIGAAADNAVPIVLSHHNLLPQSLLRVALYTELLNGGVARSRLLSSCRTVLYCHGHIHDDTIEVLSDPTSRGSKVILIAAPKFTRGFNSITVEFGRKGFPLGCLVTSHRLNVRDGALQQRTIRIPFHGPNIEDIQRFGNEHLSQVVELIPNVEVRFCELQTRLQDAHNHRFQKGTLAETLVEAEWLGCVALRNDEYTPEHWHVRRTVFK